MDVSVSIVAKIFKKSTVTIHNWLKEPNPRFTYTLDASGHKMVNFESLQDYVEKNVLFNSLNGEAYKFYADCHKAEQDIYEPVRCPHCKEIIDE